MKWYTYEIPPIDNGWENLKTVKVTASEFDIDTPFGVSDSQRFLSDWESAKVAAKHAGWEGDFRHEPVVIWLPNDTEFSYGFVFKQDNNGTTYVISPVVMSWLEPIKSN